MPGNDDIVLKLIIKGMDPAEIIRLAQETSGRLAQESAVHINKLTQLHREAAQAQSDAQKKAVDEEIKEQTKLLDAIQKIERQREIVANRAKGAMDRMLERLENVTTVATGLISAFKAQANAAFQLGEDIDRLTNVYGSLKGSIDEMRDATRGEVSDYDLIATKNRALEKELKLTDTQFGLVAAAADHYADAIGTNTKEALDKLIDGLSSGNLKMLAHAGIIVDADAAYQRYAESIGTTADRLTDSAKRIAIVQDALRAMDRKLADSGGNVDDFAHDWEKATATIKNLADAFKLDLGRAIAFVVNNLSSIGDAVGLAKAQFLDLMSLGHTDRYGALANDIENRGSRKQALDALANGSFHRGDSVPEDFLKNDKYRYQGGNTDKLIKSQTEKSYEPDIMGREYGTHQAGGTLRDLEAQAMAGTTSADDFVKGREAMAKEEEKYQAAIRGEAQKTADQMAKTLEDVAKRKDELLQTSDRAGGGLFSIMLFGPDGPDKTYAEMDSFQQATVDMMGVIADTSHKMAEAVGQSLANWVSDTQGAKKSFRDTTNELLVSLSTQAYVKGLMEVAEALASFATYNTDAGYKHLAAAGAYALVGTAAGLGARAIGHSAAAGSSTSTPTSKSGSANVAVYGTNSRSTGSGSEGPPLTINLTVLPGGEAEAGRQINKALDAYYAQTGRGAKAA